MMTWKQEEINNIVTWNHVGFLILWGFGSLVLGSCLLTLGLKRRGNLPPNPNTLFMTLTLTDDVVADYGGVATAIISTTSSSCHMVNQTYRNYTQKDVCCVAKERADMCYESYDSTYEIIIIQQKQQQSKNDDQYYHEDMTAAAVTNGSNTSVEYFTRQWKRRVCTESNCNKCPREDFNGKTYPIPPSLYDYPHDDNNHNPLYYSPINDMLNLSSSDIQCWKLKDDYVRQDDDDESKQQLLEDINSFWDCGNASKECYLPINPSIIYDEEYNSHKSTILFGSIILGLCTLLWCIACGLGWILCQY